MGASFSTNDSISQSPNRSRLNQPSNHQTNEYRNSQRYNPNLPHSARRSSANIPSSRNHFPNDFDNSLEVQIHQILHGQSDNGRHRQVQFISESDQSSGSRISNIHPSRPFSFGGDLSLMGIGSELENDNDGHAMHARLSLMPYFLGQDKKCSICKKIVPYDNFETHYVMCFTKPRVTFNDDVLTEDQGECVICLVELVRGDVIARLPCLCIYHKGCIEQWFQRNQTCPSHPEFSDSSGR